MAIELRHRKPSTRFPKTQSKCNHSLTLLLHSSHQVQSHSMDFSRPIDDDEPLYPHRPNYSRNESSTTHRSASSSTASTSYSTHIGLSASKVASPRVASPRMMPTVLGTSPMSPATGMRSTTETEWDEVDKLGYQYSLRVAQV